MRLMKKSIVVLAGVIGLVTRVAAGNGGLSPIVLAFDLGVSNYISKAGAQIQREQLLASIALLNNGTWNLANAVTNSALLPAIVGTPATLTAPAKTADNQVAALRDFLSLYALTQNTSTNGVPDGGTWSLLPVQNGEAVRAALFGGGIQATSLIEKVIIGGTGNQNPYPNIHKVLNSVGVIMEPNAVDHNSHFHIYIRPPVQRQIGAALLLADNPLAIPTDSVSPAATLQTDAQRLWDYAQDIITGEELMFTMDVPYVPVQDTPILLVQAATPGAGATPQPDYLLKDCQETTSVGDPTSAFRAVDPAYMLKNYLEWHDKSGTLVIDLSSIKTTLLQGTTHGKITSVIDNIGRSWYGYDPIPNYVGNDQAVFMAEFEGKRYKIALELHVFAGSVPGDFGDSHSTCPPPKLIKVNGKPVSGSSAYDSGYSLNSLSVTFADLAGGAVGQTNGEGPNASITLDANAAGYNWFIDTTPADNSEFLPTSNPNEWVAKAGSAAAGKMDMLSVLLHEYGHALGIEHSGDTGDYMGTTLTPGVRRLPSATELALMQQLIGEAKNGLASNTPDNNTPAPFPTLPIGTGLSLAFLGRVRSNRFGGMNIDLVSAITPAPVPRPQYEVSANATFTSLNIAAGWNTQGSVNIVSSTGTGPSTGSGQSGSGSATLNEVSTSQTRLSQVFMLGDRDR
ncbi:MAG: matrixin family metalloprotease, partial [Gallionella sp.]